MLVVHLSMSSVHVHPPLAKNARSGAHSVIFALTPIFLEDIICQRKISSLTTYNSKSEDVRKDHFRNYFS